MAKLLLVLAGLIALGGGLAACGGDGGNSDESSGPSDTSGKPFPVAMVAPLSGASAKVGEEMKQSVELALDEVDYKVGDYRIEPVWVDEVGGDPQKATQGYESAIVGKDVQAGLLNWHGSVGIALMEVAARHKVPHLFGLASPAIIKDKFKEDPDKYGYWTTKGWPVPDSLVDTYVDALDEAVENGTIPDDNRTVALWAEDSDFGREWLAGVAASFERSGWTVEAKEFVGASSTDLYGLIEKLNDTGAAVIAGTASAPDLNASFLKQSYESGTKAVRLLDGLGYIGDFYDLTGPASDGVIDMQPQFATDKAKEFEERYKDKYGTEPGAAAAGLPYDYTKFALKIFARALKKYGELTKESVYKLVRDEVWTGKLTYDDGIIMDRYEYTKDTIPDPKVGNGFFQFPVIQYEGGEPNIVYPPSIRDSEIEVGD